MSTRRLTMGQLASLMHAAAKQVDPQSSVKLQTFAQVGVGFMKQAIQDMHAVDTGTTVNSVSAESISRGTVLIGPTTSYAPYIALGTSRMAARPFHIVAARKLSDRRRVHWRAFASDLGL